MSIKMYNTINNDVSTYCVWQIIVEVHDIQKYNSLLVSLIIRNNSSFTSFKSGIRLNQIKLTSVLFLLRQETT